MSKGYWVCAYRKITDLAALAAYIELATPAVEDGGGRFLVRGMADDVREDGIKERTGVVEFESLEKAVATYESKAYQKAIAVLGDTLQRDFRIVRSVNSGS